MLDMWPQSWLPSIEVALFVGVEVEVNPEKTKTWPEPHDQSKPRWYYLVKPAEKQFKLPREHLSMELENRWQIFCTNFPTIGLRILSAHSGRISQ